MENHIKIIQYINQLKIELDRSKEERQREMNENEHKVNFATNFN
jgi:hypothetical protein